MRKPGTAATTRTWSLPPAVNFHLWKACNLRCTFCHSSFADDPPLRDLRGGLPFASARKIIECLRAEGVQKLNLAGGEPTLCPYLPALLRHSRELGFVTTLVTNGARLQQVLDAVGDCLDGVGLSVDSANETTQSILGRGDGTHVQRSLAYAAALHERGIPVKLNTVVTSHNWQEDMSNFVGKVRPARWKIFQVLPVQGQNMARVAPLLVSADHFRSFVDRHRHLAALGITLAPETNEAMSGSYAMVDPLGRFFSNVGGRHSYSPPILQVGAAAAFDSIAFSPEAFIARRGLYDWGKPGRGAAPPAQVC